MKSELFSSRGVGLYEGKRAIKDEMGKFCKLKVF